MASSPGAWHKLVFDSLLRKKSDRNPIDMSGVGVPSDSQINAIIEGEIIPRLLISYSDSLQPDKAARQSEIDPVNISKFATLPLHTEAADLLDEVNSYLDQGVNPEAIYIDLLAPAARKLGQLWEEDQCDFIDVTMGLWRLQEVMREVAARSPELSRAASSKHSALFAPMPGDQHTFGAIMIEEVFARAGWDSDVVVEPIRRELLERVASKPFDLIGLTITRDCPSAGVAQIVTAIRSVSANPNIRVMVGGRMVDETPGLVEEVGADGSASDARDALHVAEQLVLSARSPAHATQ